MVWVGVDGCKRSTGVSDGSEMRVERRRKDKKMGERGFLWEARDCVDAGWRVGTCALGGDWQNGIEVRKPLAVPNSPASCGLACLVDGKIVYVIHHT